MKLNTLSLAHDFLKRNVTFGGICIDATAGRGNDTAFLCELVGDCGKVISFDIQQEAIDSTNNLIKQKGFENIATVYLDSHSNMDKYAQEKSVDAIVFNFGYLPKGDHNISTQPHTSIKAIETGLTLLKPTGVMCLCIYHGGDTGYVERDALLEYLKTVNPKQYTVLVTNFHNRPNDPPILVYIYNRI